MAQRSNRLPLISSLVFLAGAWAVGDFIGLFTHPGPLEIGLLAAFAALGGWRVASSRDRRDLMRKLALLTASLTISLALTEVWFIRHVAALTPGREEEFLSRNASGPSVGLERTQGVFRLLGLADSFGVYGGSNNYHYRVKSLLAEQGSAPLEFINASASGSAPGDQLALYRGFARYRPDLVLHGFYTGNDFIRPDGVLVQYHGVTWRHYFSWKELRPRHFLLRKWLFRLFAAWRKTGRIASLPLGPGPAHALTEQETEKGIFPYDVYLEIERSNLLSSFRRLDHLERRWAHTAQILDLLKQEVEASGGRYALVIHPDRVQVDKDLQETLFGRFGLSRAEFDLEQPQRFLLGWCRERKAACLDLLGAFRAHGSPGDLYLANGIHYSSAGNDLAARTIARWLMEEGLVPAAGAPRLGTLPLKTYKTMPLGTLTQALESRSLFHKLLIWARRKPILHCIRRNLHLQEGLC